MMLLFIAIRLFLITVALAGAAGFSTSSQTVSSSVSVVIRWAFIIRTHDVDNSLSGYAEPLTCRHEDVVSCFRQEL